MFELPNSEQMTIIGLALLAGVFVWAWNTYVKGKSDTWEGE